MSGLEKEVLLDVHDKVEKYTKNPADFLSVQVKLAEEIKVIIKRLYDLSKDNDKSTNTLPELIVDNFDEEQIWQELELRNEEKLPSYIADVSMVLSRKERLKTVLNSLSIDGDFKSSNEDSDGSVEESSDEDDSISASLEKGDSEDDKLPEDLNDEVSDDGTKKPKRKSVVDDTFFKLHELEDFLNKEEREKEQDDDSADEEEIDYFEEGLDKLETKKSELNPKYKDFFPLPKIDDVDEKEPNTDKKLEGIRHALQEIASKGDKKRSLDNDVEEKSMFEERQERLLKKIKHLETSNIAEKPWQMMGEVTASARPPNSLLEEILEVDISSRPAPIITEKTTLKLEDIIRQRIKDKAWDDVEKKFKPVDTPAEFKKKLVLDQEKSKMSLAEVYEQEYLKQKKELATGPDDKEKELEEHKVIKKMMASLFLKLDALSNFHYTPKPVIPDVQIISHVPAIEIEEVAPVAASDAKLLAPEEVKAKPKGDVRGKGERSETDKKRERRQKKRRQKARRIERERREKAVSKLNPGLGNKYSKEKAIKLLEKVSKEDNVELLEGQKTVVKSSKTFFSLLQDEVANHVKVRASGSKKKAKQKTLAQKVKL